MACYSQTGLLQSLDILYKIQYTRVEGDVYAIALHETSLLSVYLLVRGLYFYLHTRFSCHRLPKLYANNKTPSRQRPGRGLIPKGRKCQEPKPTLNSTSLIFWASCSVRSTKGRRRGPVSTPTNSKARFTGTGLVVMNMALNKGISLR